MQRTIAMRCLAVSLALIVSSVLDAANDVVASPMVGQWEGSTHVIVAWCKQKELAVSLHVSADGSVTGKVGDAELTNAQIKRKRHWFGQERHGRTTHIIKGDLKGPIVAAEGISRQEVFIHVSIEEASLSGSLATSGSKFGGKDSMILTTTSLRLVKS